MEKFTPLTAKAVPVNRSNVDTDAIIPKQYLKSIKRSGFGVYLFDAWRYLDEGDLDTDVSTRRINPDFELNQARYQNASILLAGENFGCGSSREHAAWALADYGIRAIIAPSYAEIFYNNCFKNGLLPIRLPASTVSRLIADVESGASQAITVDLANQCVQAGGQTLPFEVDGFRKHCLLNGMDDIDLTLQYAQDIKTFEQNRRRQAPWLFVDIV